MKIFDWYNRKMRHVHEARTVKRMIWPTPETDYDGNELWAMRFPKPKPLSPDQLAFYKYLADRQMSMWDYMCESANRQIYWQAQNNSLFHSLGLSGLGGYRL